MRSDDRVELLNTEEMMLEFGATCELDSQGGRRIEKVKRGIA